jgi:hypothetical protein
LKIYPHPNKVLILTDAIFADYGGVTGTTTANMRAAAYQIAEQQMSSYIDTLLLPTVITGTYNYNPGCSILNTDYGYVSDILWVKILDPHGVALGMLTGTYTNYASIHEDTYGYIYVNQCLSMCGAYNQPYQFQVAYEAGLPTGTSSQPGMLMALSGAAQITLNEMLLVPANETTGDAGVETYRSLNYSETRKKWRNTIFGSSVQAAKIANFVDGTIKKARRGVMLGKF